MYNEFFIKGLYEFPDGSKYEGEWKDQKMHGDGVFTDLNGNKWEGEEQLYIGSKLNN